MRCIKRLSMSTEPLVKTFAMLAIRPKSAKSQVVAVILTRLMVGIGLGISEQLVMNHGDVFL